MLGADCYLTGDVRYHDAQHAAALGIHLIDAGHFATEYPIAHALKEYLQKELPDVRVYEDKMAKDFFKTL
jgi:putative NIF3 family GTP cyclohydrolase 1 type 2